jgi:hypothetical protein
MSHYISHFLVAHWLMLLYGKLSQLNWVTISMLGKTEDQLSSF